MSGTRREREWVYGVMFVQDHELPEKDWMLIRVEGRTELVVRDSAVTPEVLEQAWSAYRRSMEIFPGQRRASETIPRSEVAG